MQTTRQGLHGLHLARILVGWSRVWIADVERLQTGGIVFAFTMLSTIAWHRCF